MKKTGYVIVFSDNTKAEIALGDTERDTVFETENFTVTIGNSGFQVASPAGFGRPSALHIKSVEFVEFEFEVDPSLETKSDEKRTCAGSCCITNGCAVCGGGWICDLR